MSETYEFTVERKDDIRVFLPPLAEAENALRARQVAEFGGMFEAQKAAPETVFAEPMPDVLPAPAPTIQPIETPAPDAVPDAFLGGAVRFLALAAGVLFGGFLLWELAVGVAVGIRSMGEMVGEAIAVTVGNLAVWACYFCGGLAAFWVLAAWLKSLFAAKPAEDYPIFHRNETLAGNTTSPKKRRFESTFTEIIEE